MAQRAGGGFADRRGGERQPFATSMNLVAMESGEMGKEGGDVHDG
jgi:hypothetical protein